MQGLAALGTLSVFFASALSQGSELVLDASFCYRLVMQGWSCAVRLQGSTPLAVACEPYVGNLPGDASVRGLADVAVACEHNRAVDAQLESVVDLPRRPPNTAAQNAGEIPQLGLGHRCAINTQFSRQGSLARQKARRPRPLPQPPHLAQPPPPRATSCRAGTRRPTAGAHPRY